jgi:hypothetical protein
MWDQCFCPASCEDRQPLPAWENQLVRLLPNLVYVALDEARDDLEGYSEP